MKGKPPKESIVEMVQQVLPGDANPIGTVFGGKVMEWIDIAGAVFAMRHTQQQVVTASFDRGDFFAPARVGEVMVLQAKINFTGKTSLEVGISVQSENPITGAKVRTAEALVTYVAVNEKGKPIPVLPIIPGTEEERRNFEEGKKRHEIRRRERKRS